MLLDITGKEVQVGDVLAISRSRGRDLFKATVVGIAAETRRMWFYDKERKAGERTSTPSTCFTMRLHSDGRLMDARDRDLYQATVIIGQE
jgi:hypothetical protein